MMHKKLVVALAATVGLTVIGAAPAQADGGVTIWKIGTKATKYKKPSLTLKPDVFADYGVKVDSKTLTVKKGKKTVAKNKTSVKLKPGKYKVTTTVKYRSSNDVTQNVLRIPAGQPLSGQTTLPYTYDGPYMTSCNVARYASDTDFNLVCNVSKATVGVVNITNDQVLGYSPGWDISDVRHGGVVYLAAISSPVDILTPTAVTVFSAPKTKTRAQTVKVKKGKKPAPPTKCATYSSYKAVYDGDSTSEVYRLLGPSKVALESGNFIIRDYKPCKKFQIFQVSFEDGKVVGKTYIG